MSSLTTPTTLLNPQFNKANNTQQYKLPRRVQATLSSEENVSNRRGIVTSLLASSIALGLNATQAALAENWGVRSFIKEKYFEPDLSPEDSAARIRQTAEGLHSLQEMLDVMSWKYVLFYIRLKAAYLSKDMKNALPVVPQSQRKSYVDTANQLVDNMAEFDHYIRTPKVFESYVYYKKTLKSIDNLVVLLA
ncbi:hypothetical protein LIER_30628 [Lithospermum erythrorhizon]|uniref:Photosynthetic NDH subcomplex L 2 n=1 Tax=Lithospermum erythrorhizon TaxID=34254 RepID=A0AAV3RQA4_LITER